MAEGVQVPTEPARSQRRQLPAQALLQQTPSTHWPEAHWQPSLHPTPLARLAEHAVPTQAKPDLHCVDEQPPEQLVEHAPEPLHMRLPQPPSGSVPAGRLVQVPRLLARLQARHGPVQLLLQQKPSTQLPDWHSQPAPQVTPRAFLAVHRPPEQ
jgi:hypothetical protein